MRYIVNDPDTGSELYYYEAEARHAFDRIVERLREEAGDGWHDDADSAFWGEVIPRQWLVLRVTATPNDGTPEGERCAAADWAFIAEGVVEDVPAAAAQPDPPPVPDPYAAGLAAGRLQELEAVIAWLLRAPETRLWRQEPMEATAAALLRGEHLATPTADPTTDKAQLAALSQRGDRS